MKEELAKTYSKWETDVLTPFMDAQSNQDQFSQPFFVGLSSQFNPHKKTIMVVGQQMGQCEKYSQRWGISKFQDWATRYFDYNLYDLNGDGFGRKNTSPFWNFLRDLKSDHYNIVWNNLDKIENLDDPKKQLTLNMERPLHKKFGSKNKTILEYEIEIIRPEMIVFMTGPEFDQSICVSLGLDENLLKHSKPRTDLICQDITDQLGLGIKSFWTYHPGFLNRNPGFMNNCVEYLKKQL